MTDAVEKIVHVLINGRVQGVGFRAWTVEEAEARRLRGWVRNLRGGGVEAVFAGPPRAVDAMVEASRKGPYGARVTGVEARTGTAAELALAQGYSGFAHLPTR
ncbi:MAG: acylphosphatase [Methylobacteriaceae bacterium]|nr:acylphosphatase [Methylobacteriaceae bacterium]